jgi:hypothetical protein
MKLNYILTVHDEEGAETSFAPFDTYSAVKLIEYIEAVEKWRLGQEQQDSMRLQDEEEEITPEEQVREEIGSHLHAAGIQVEPPHQTDTPD